MTRVLSILLWTAVFLLIVLAVDQLLVRVPASLPSHVAVAGFYRDLRARMLDLLTGVEPVPAPTKPATSGKGKGKAAPPSPASVEAIIEQHRTSPVPPPAKRPAVPVAKPRYVYADAEGAIHFAETLAEVPEQYRSKAKALGE